MGEVVAGVMRPRPPATAQTMDTRPRLGERGESALRLRPDLAQEEEARSGYAGSCKGSEVKLW